MRAERLRVGFVGVGQMGRPMVERLLAASFPVRFFARRADVAGPLAGQGAVAAGTVAGAGRDCDVVAVCVFTDDQVRQVALGRDGLLGAMAPGSTLVVHTTGSPRTVTALAGAGAEAGVAVLDAAVSGSPADVRAGRLTLLVGGDVDVLERCRPVLAAYGEPILHLGALGHGMRVKLVNNALLAANVQLALEAGRLAERLDVPARTALEALTRCSGATHALGLSLRSPSLEEFQAGIVRFLAKDVAVAEATAAELGVDLGLLGAMARAGVTTPGEERSP